MSYTLTKTITLTTIECASCGVTFALPQSLKEQFQKSHNSFYCPSGHSNYYSCDNEAEKLRKELKRKEQELANEVERRLIIKNDLETIIENQERDLKRFTNGVCPCCNRSFKNLATHMKKQHPETVSKKR